MLVDGFAQLMEERQKFVNDQHSGVIKQVGLRKTHSHAAHAADYPAYRKMLTDEDMRESVHMGIVLCSELLGNVGYGPLLRRFPTF